MRQIRTLLPLLSLVAVLAGCGGSTPPEVPSSPNDAGPGADAGGETGNDAGTANLVGIEVTPTAPTIAQMTSLQLSATGTYEDGSTADVTNAVTWSSSDTAVATVDEDGTASGLSPGIAQLSATLSGITATTELTVTDASLESLAIEPLTASLPVGVTQAFSAIGTFSDGTTQSLTSQVEWSSSDTAIAAFSADPASPGLIEALAEGQTTVSASLNGVSASTELSVVAAALTSLTISPPSPQLAAGTSLSLTAEGSFTDGSAREVTADVTWGSSDTTIATVSDAPTSKGRLSGVTAGSASITAILDGITTSASVTVTSATLDSITVEPATANLAVDSSLQYLARGTFSDGTTQDLTDQVTWASSDPAVATISNAAGSQGEAKGVASGQTEISATYGTTVGTAQLTVTVVTLDSVEITPANPSIITGTSTALEATAVFSDGSRQDVTEAATWSSTNAAVASVSNAPGSRGRVSGVSAGTATISAAINGVTGSTVVTVVDATLTGITVSPDPASVPMGYSRGFTALGTFDNGGTQDVTATVTWSSSDTAILQVSNTNGSRGEAEGVSAGTVTLSATQSGITGTAAVTVTSATLSSIAVAPSTLTLQSQERAQLTATGTFDDGTTLDITEQVNWSSSSNFVASVSNFEGSKGEVFAITQGSATITAAVAGRSGTADVTVQP